MIRKTCLILDGSPILSGMASGLACLWPPAAEKIFSSRSQWLFWNTCCVSDHKAEELGTGTMLTVPRSWWVSSAVTPNSDVVELSVVGASGTFPAKGFGLPVVDRQSLV